MPKYYCDYCKSYLTHDTMSVRKSHLMGKNHIKFYCSYYETKAKETGIWDPTETPYQISLDVVIRGAPGDSNQIANALDSENFKLPPPPNLSNFPNPPPSAFNYTKEYKDAISEHLTRDEL